MMNVIKRKNLWFTLSGLAVGLSLVAMMVWHLNFGIDFTGGSLLELSFEKKVPEPQLVATAIHAAAQVENPTVQPVGSSGLIIRFTTIDEVTHQKVLTQLHEQFSDAGIREERFNSIGPSVGNDLKVKTVQAVILACILIVLYIAWAFRHVSKPVSSWKYGLIAIIALIHDVTITPGAFSILGRFYEIEINAPFIAAFLTVLGYSVNDTIVIFDRIRENLIKHYAGNLETVVERSVNETMVRSLYTSATVIIVLFCILIFGGTTIRDFSLALIIGVTVGTYSSIFIASPLLIVFDNLSNRFKKNR